MGAKRVDVPSISESPDSPKSKPPVDTTDVKVGSKFRAPDRQDIPDGKGNTLKQITNFLDTINDPEIIESTIFKINGEQPTYGNQLTRYLVKRSLTEKMNDNFALAKKLDEILKRLELYQKRLNKPNTLDDDEGIASDGSYE